MHKILVLLLYYERPQMVRGALRSVVRANEHYQNWILAVHDDGSPTPVLPIVKEELGPLMTPDRVKVIRCGMTPADKLNHGCFLGLGMNTLIQRTDADIGVMLCDDDELIPDYLKNLDAFFTQNPGAESCYSHVVQFDPLTENTNDLLLAPQLSRVITGKGHPDYAEYNCYTEPINPFCKLDASQVAWRISVNKQKGVWFKYPLSRNHDAHFFRELYEKTGPTPYSGCFSQFKGIHTKQLTRIKDEDAWRQGASLVDR